MKAKFLLAAMLILTLSIGSAFAGTTKTETFKTEKIDGKAGQYHRHHHHRFHHHHHMMH
jgi:hypothetical protein